MGRNKRREQGREQGRDPRHRRTEDGVVTRIHARRCRVMVGTEEVDCRIRGLLFRQEQTWSRPVAVGDRVKIARSGEGEGVVQEVLPRVRVLARPREDGRRDQLIAANVDQAILVSSVAEPAFNARLLDRLMVACEKEEFDQVLVINKVDLIESRAALDPIEEIYGPLGRHLLFTSASTGEGIAELAHLLQDKISVFAGMSGVGKSALLTAVQPDLALRSEEVSARSGKGRHTTSHVSLLALERGGFVVDTPGVREFGISGLEAHEVARCFPEFVPHAGRCRYRTCTHSHEDRCAVQEAVERGEIHPHRYDSYLRIVGTLGS
jgi:ribosome biogenesis GTPase